jgi:hypothetical protein
MLRAVCLLILLTVVVAGGPTPARAAAPQVWVLIHVKDPDKDPGTVDVRMPLEALRDMKGTVSCDEDEDGDDSGKERIEGREIYERYRNLSPGEERQVESRRCHDAHITITASCRDAEEGPPATRLRILVRDKDGDSADNIDLGLSMDTLKDLGSLLNLVGLGSHTKAKDYVKEFPGGLDLLKRLPPFEMVRVIDKGETVIIRTE